MSLEERFVGRYVLDAYDVVGAYLDYFVHQLERIAVRQQFTDAVYIHNRFAVAVVCRSLYLVQADFLTHLAGKLIVDGMSRTRGDDTALDGLADQSQVADYVQQFVAGAFVGPYQRFVVDVTQLFGIHVRHAHYVGELVVSILRHFALVDNDGVVQVAAFDKSGLQQRFYLAYEYESTAGGYFILELCHVFQCGKLVGDDSRVVGYQHVQAEVLIG